MSALNILSGIIGVSLLILWVKGLASWDGENECDPKECESCPFPCDGHNSKIK